MLSLRPHRKFDFVKHWKTGFIVSAVLIALAIVGFVVSTVLTGAPLTLGTEFSGGTSIQINEATGISEDELEDAFAQAAGELGYDTQISSVQTATTMSGGEGYIVKTTDTVSTNASEIMAGVEDKLGINSSDVEIETIGASWGASVIWSSIIAFLLSCIGILVIIAIRYREPRMGVVALICLFHDMIIVLGVYAWAGMILHMEITSDVIAALLAIIGYSLYDTVVVFHRISRNASPQMKMSLRTCANQSLNEVIVRSLNTSITSILPILFMLILGTDTLLDFAFAMFCGMLIGIYSTLAISAPIYTTWKAKEPAYARLEKKYPYEVLQSPFTKEMMIEARKESKAKREAERAMEKEERAQERLEKAEGRSKAREEKRAGEAVERARRAESEAAEELREAQVEFDRAAEVSEAEHAVAEEAVELAEEELASDRDDSERIEVIQDPGSIEVARESDDGFDADDVFGLADDEFEVLEVPMESDPKSNPKLNCAKPDDDSQISVSFTDPDDD